jgi:chemotaxis regulatin CheY-phosphate phosphatase CheZ
MEIDKYLKEQLCDVRRYLDREREWMQEQIDTQNFYLKLMERYEEVLAENEQLKSELEQQLAENDSPHRFPHRHHHHELYGSRSD